MCQIPSPLWESLPGQPGSRDDDGERDARIGGWRSCDLPGGQRDDGAQRQNMRRQRCVPASTKLRCSPPKIDLNVFRVQNCEIFGFSSAVLTPFKVEICDTSGAEFGAYTHGGVMRQIKTPKTAHFVRSQSLFAKQKKFTNFVQMVQLSSGFWSASVAVDSLWFLSLQAALQQNTISPSTKIGQHVMSLRRGPTSRDNCCASHVDCRSLWNSSWCHRRC